MFKLKLSRADQPGTAPRRSVLSTLLATLMGSPPPGPAEPKLTPRQRFEERARERIACSPSEGVQRMRILDRIYQRLGWEPVRPSGLVRQKNRKGFDANLVRQYATKIPPHMAHLEGRARRRALRWLNAKPGRYFDEAGRRCTGAHLVGISDQ